MGRDVERFCEECERCMTRNPPVPAPRAAMGELPASEPWQVVSIDFLTDLPTTLSGNKHLLVCCDHFTRWCEAFPVPDMSARTVAEVLTRELFSRYSIPQVIHSDQAGNFRSQLLAEVYRIMGVKRSLTSSYHPQGNGKCERVNRGLIGMLSKYLDQNQHSGWDEHLPLLMLGYRTQVHRSLGYSPFFLMFGRQPRLPVDLEIDAPCRPKSVTITEYVDRLCEGLREAYREAIKMSNASHEKNKQLYDKRLNAFHYEPGDKALLFRKVVKKGMFYKFLRPWRPVTIVERRGDLNYRIRAEDGKMLTVHHNRLRPSTVRDFVESGPSDLEIPQSREPESRVVLSPHHSDRSESHAVPRSVPGPSDDSSETEPLSGSHAAPLAQGNSRPSLVPAPPESTLSSPDDTGGVRGEISELPPHRSEIPTQLSELRRSSRTRRPPDRLALTLSSERSDLV